jgi:hypothetical protein
MAERLWQHQFEYELESVDLVDLLADLSKSERPHERQRGGVALPLRLLPGYTFTVSPGGASVGRSSPRRGIVPQPCFLRARSISARQRQNAFSCR